MTHLDLCSSAFRIGIAGLLSAVVACVACATKREPSPVSSVGSMGCTRDGDCSSDFCDLGLCRSLPAEGYGAGNYGRDCGPALEFRCGAYRCSDGRCRSCASSEDCEGPPGATLTCGPESGFEGHRCGRLLPTESAASPAASTTSPPATER